MDSVIEQFLRAILIAGGVYGMLYWMRKNMSTTPVPEKDGTSSLRPNVVFRILFWLLIVVLGILTVMFILHPPKNEGDLIAFLCMLLGFGAFLLWVSLMLFRYRVYWDDRGLYVRGMVYGLAFCPWEEITGGEYAGFSGNIILHSPTGGIRFQAYMRGTPVLLQEIMRRTGLPREAFQIPQSFFIPQG